MQRKIFLETKDSIKFVKKKKSLKPPARTAKKIRFVDLFSGCGGLSLGIQTAAREAGMGSMCTLAVDTHSSPLEVYKQNIKFKNGAVVCSSVLDLFNAQDSKSFSRKELALKKKVGKVDILVAGPPCQGHSNLNNRTRRNDPRNSLYLACIRAVRLLAPQLVLIENVPAVIHSKEGVVSQTAETLESLGYSVRTFLINFLSLGVPQTRRRHVLIASKDKVFISSLELSNNAQTPTLRDFISDLKLGSGAMYEAGKISPANKERINYLFEHKLYDLPDSIRPACHRDKNHSYKSVYGRLHFDKPAQTITSGYGSMGQGRYVHPKEKRTINSREAARIQGFPDFFEFDRASKLTDLRQMIANAVPPQLSYVLTNYYIQAERQEV